MIHFKLNGKKLSVPSVWDDVNFNNYCEILKTPRELTALISMFTGIDCEILNKATIIGLDEVVQALSFLKKPPEVPGYVSKCGKYDIPVTKDGKFNIQFESLAQFEDMKQVIQSITDKDTHAFTVSLGQYVAIYLQKIRDGEYNPEKDKEMVSEVNLMPALEVISLGSFFFIKVLSLSAGTKPNSHPTNPSQKKSKLAMKGSHKHSGRTARSRKRR